MRKFSDFIVQYAAAILATATIAAAPWLISHINVFWNFLKL
jgi:hypothetical protein